MHAAPVSPETRLLRLDHQIVGPTDTSSHATVSETLGGFLETPALLLSGAHAWGLDWTPNSTGVSEVIWYNAITKVKQIKTMHGYAITCPLCELLALPLLTDVRFGIWMLGNERVIQHEVTCAELWMLVTAHVRGLQYPRYPNGKIMIFLKFLQRLNEQDRFIYVSST